MLCVPVMCVGDALWYPCTIYCNSNNHWNHLGKRILEMAICTLRSYLLSLFFKEMSTVTDEKIALFLHYYNALSCAGMTARQDGHLNQCGTYKIAQNLL